MKTYFIASDAFIKIGRSEQPEVRLRQLKTGSPAELQLLLVLDGDREQEFHEQFKHLHVSGEWFARGDELENFIARATGFQKWLFAQADRDDLVGDLARDAIQDVNWPPTSSYRQLKNYLHLAHACAGAVEALLRAFLEYRRQADRKAAAR